MNYYEAKISESDQRQRFSLIDGLFKVKTVPPLPSHESTQTLAEDFTDFFVNKIQDLTLFRLVGRGAGGGKCPRRFQLSRTSLKFKQYLPNVATFTKIY